MSGILFEARAFRLSDGSLHQPIRARHRDHPASQGVLDPRLAPARRAEGAPKRRSAGMTNETLCPANEIALRFGELGSGAIQTAEKRLRTRRRLPCWSVSSAWVAP